MNTLTIVVLIASVPATVLGVALFGRSVMRRVRAAHREATGSYARLEPLLLELRERGEVTRRELARLENRQVAERGASWPADHVAPRAGRPTR